MLQALNQTKRFNKIYDCYQAFCETSDPLRRFISYLKIASHFAGDITKLFSINTNIYDDDDEVIYWWSERYSFSAVGSTSPKKMQIVSTLPAL